MSWTLQDYNNTGDNSASAFYGVNWNAQTFTTTGSYTITRVKIKAYKTGGSPGTMTLSIKAVVGGQPSGGDLCSGTYNANDFTTDTSGEWYEITLGAGAALTGSTQYAIVVRCPDGADINNAGAWRNYNAAGGNYAGGSVWASSDSGSSWTASTNRDNMFETYSGVESSYSDISATITLTVDLTGVLSSNAFRDMSATISLAVALSGDLSATRTGTGMLSRANKVTSRLIAIGNNCLYYEDI